MGAALGSAVVLDASEVLVLLDAGVRSPPVPHAHPVRLAWALFRDPIFLARHRAGVGIQAIYVVVFLGAAWATSITGRHR